MLTVSLTGFEPTADTGGTAGSIPPKPVVLNPASRSRTGHTMLRCAKLLSPPPDFHTGTRTNFSEPQFVADDGDHVLLIDPFSIRVLRSFNVQSYDLVRIVG